jgi:hypothetical protein
MLATSTRTRTHVREPERCSTSTMPLGRTARVK